VHSFLLPLQQETATLQLPQDYFTYFFKMCRKAAVWIVFPSPVQQGNMR